MSGARLPVLLYALMVWAGTSSPFMYVFKHPVMTRNVFQFKFTTVSCKVTEFKKFVPGGSLTNKIHLLRVEMDFFLVVYPCRVLQSQVLGYDKYTTNFINIKCHINDILC